MCASILMLSAKSGEWDIAEGLDLGADDYVTKPADTGIPRPTGFLDCNIKWKPGNEPDYFPA